MARPTLDTIAKIAGVSPSTVSLVLNEKGNISEETRARIRRAIYETGYRRVPHHRKIALVGKATPAFKSATRQAAAEYGYELASVPTNTELEQYHPDELGGIIVYGGHWEPSSLDEISSAYSTVLLGGHTRSTVVDSIWVDNIDGIYSAVNYLIDRGHRCIGLVNGPMSSAASWEKQLGFDRATALAKVPIQGHSIASRSFSANSAREAVSALLLEHPGMSALIVGETIPGIAVHEYLTEQGLSIPDDMSLMVFHDDPRLSELAPPTTAIGFSYLDIARATMARLIRRMNGSPTQARRILFKPFIVERASVADVSTA